MPIERTPETFKVGVLSRKYQNSGQINIGDLEYIETNETRCFKKFVRIVKKVGFDFVCIPVNKSETSDTEESEFRSNPKYPEHYEINGHEWNSGIIGIFPSNGHLNVFEAKKLLEWCEYIGYHAVVINIDQLSINFLSILLSFIGNVSSGVQIWVEIVIKNESIDSLWDKWQFISSIIGNGLANIRVGILFNISYNAMGYFGNYSRFFGEPIKCIIIESDYFQTNSHSQPIRIPDLLINCLRIKIPIVLNMDSEHNFDMETNIKDNYRNIVEFINLLPPLTKQQIYEYNYVDILQMPLQPLHKNLKSIEYEVFESDLIKYDKYYQAIKSFISDHIDKLEELNIMVVGAGRGGLIYSSIKAIENLNIKSFNIVSIEKNINAVITLKARIANEFKHYSKNISVVHSDIRNLSLKDEFDLIISELLGSFSDNELSPECLAHAQNFLKPKGVMIPQNYCSFVEPISCKKIWNTAVMHLRGTSLETPFVCRLKSKYDISIEGPKKVFSFHHPINSFEDDQDMIFASIDFTSKTNSTLHGFLGHFECILYKDIGFSTNPKRASDGLTSWFDFFIPIDNPISISKSDIITFNIWRKSSKDKIWYEWLVTSPLTSHLHNSNGRIYSIYL
ncbi:Protein arginine N-methyltransferase 5 [Cryptosporidium felis]|nr:Protein arginine N-methyltransferase 5 [Cryptosporidium felis]